MDTSINRRPHMYTQNPLTFFHNYKFNKMHNIARTGSSDPNSPYSHLCTFLLCHVYSLGNEIVYCILVR